MDEDKRERIWELLNQTLAIYYMGRESEISESKKKEKIEESKKEFKKLFFKDEHTVSDVCLNDIVDAFAKIGDDGSLLSKFDKGSINKILMMFQRWIVQKPVGEDIFVNDLVEEEIEEGSFSREYGAMKDYSKVGAERSEMPYISGEGSEGLGREYDGGESGESIYMEVERKKLEELDDTSI